MQPARRGPGRPRGFDPRKALGRAREVFHAKGFAATSLDDLAAATGLNRPSLYAAFGDKEALYIRALDAYAGKLLEGMEAILSDPAPIARRLSKVFEATIAIYTAPPMHAGCMLVGTATTEAPSRPAVAAAASRLARAFEDAFERAFTRAVKSGELSRSPTPRARAQLAQALLHTLSVRARVGDRPKELASVVRAILPLIVR